MRLSPDLIIRFQNRYFEAFAEQLSPEDAEAELLDLAQLIKITAPNPRGHAKDMKYGEEYGHFTTQQPHN